MSAYYKFSNPKSEAEVLRDARATLVQAVENVRAREHPRHAQSLEAVLREFDRLVRSGEPHGGGG